MNIYQTFLMGINLNPQTLIVKANAPINAAKIALKAGASWGKYITVRVTLLRDLNKGKAGVLWSSLDSLCFRKLKRRILPM